MSEIHKNLQGCDTYYLRECVWSYVFIKSSNEAGRKSHIMLNVYFFVVFSVPFYLKKK